MSKRDDFIEGPNHLRLSLIKQHLKTIKLAGYDKEAKFLESEIRSLRQRLGLVYDTVEPVFHENLKRRKQPSSAAKMRHEALSEYKEKLKAWARGKYEEDRTSREEKGMLQRAKKDGKNNAASWLLSLFDEDREVENNAHGIPINEETGNHHGSPEPPLSPKFTASKNFFYDAIKD